MAYVPRFLCCPHCGARSFLSRLEVYRCRACGQLCCERCLRRHCEQHVPWGAELGFTVVDTGEATQIDATGPAYNAARAAFAEAWDGTPPIDMGIGGSIPFIAEFVEAFPRASVLVTGVEDPDTRAHGANEGLHLGMFARVVHAEALLLERLGRDLV